MTEYHARTVQFAWFVNDTSKLDATILFRALTGEEPDTSNRNRVPSPAAPYLTSARRVAGDASTTINVSPGRVDMFIQPERSVDADQSSPATIDAKATMLNYMALLRDAKDLKLEGAYRLAVVCNFIEIFGQHADARSAFFRKLGRPEVEGDVWDLAFQINKRFHFDAAKLSVNRLFSMNIEVLQQMQVLGGSPALQFLSNGRIVNESFILSYNVDVNNVPVNGRELGSKEALETFQRFVDEVLRVRQLNQVGEL